MTKITAGVLMVMAAYLVFMVLVGVYYSKHNSDTSDFYLGGRKLGPLVTAMSAEASDMSSWLLMGLPGVAYLSGIAEAGWTAIGLALGTYLNWLLVARRLRHYTAVTGDAITIPQFFSNRYRDKSNALLAIAALLIVIFFVPYTASGFAACGKLFSVMFNIPYVYAMIGSAAIIVAYTALGGFLAASTTDLIQSIIMTAALIVVSLFGLYAAGGFDNVATNTDKLQGYLSLLSSYDLNTGKGNSMSILTIASNFAWGLGYFGMPHVLLRFMGTKDRYSMGSDFNVYCYFNRNNRAWNDKGGSNRSLHEARRIGEVDYRYCAASQQKRLFCSSHVRTHTFRDTGLYDVHFGFAVISGIFECFRKHRKRFLRYKVIKEVGNADGKVYRACDCGDSSVFGKGS